MSNPAVLSLASMDMIDGFNYRFEIEDNIGEAIHVHYKDIRIDLTVEEFYKISEKMGNIIDNIIGIEGFSYKDFDPVNLLGLAGILSDLEKITYDEILLEELLIDTYDEEGKEVIRPLKESRVVKALQGMTAENDMRRQINYYSSEGARRQSNMERVLYNMKQIKENGYPVSNELILLFNDSNRIYDGQHRAACLYYLNGGNTKVKVKRLWFKHGQHSLNNNSDIKQKEYFLNSKENSLRIENSQKIKSIYIDLSNLMINKEKYKVVMRKGEKY